MPKKEIIIKTLILTLICIIIYLPALSFYFYSNDFDRKGTSILEFGKSMVKKVIYKNRNN